MERKSSGGLRVAVLRLSIALATLSTPVMAFSAPTAATPATSSARSAATSSVAGTLFSQSAWTNAALGGIDPKVLSLAIEAASAAVTRGQAAAPATLTVIDYSRPSTEKRMWVYDVRTHALLFDELVSHGRGSGRTMSTSFSNDPESNKSSLGLFRTAEAYMGHNGYSLRLDGLEAGVNDHARARAIVIHGAPYVNAATAKANGYLGRSLGCPAVRPEIAHALIDAVKGGGLVFAYYPDQAWLNSSSYLN
jgi:L,D-transpeptidase catalytic domain